MEKKRVAINGLGRIGRAFLRLAIHNENIEIVAVNDLGNGSNVAYLIKYDSVYGKSGLDVSFIKDTENNYLALGDKKIVMLSEKDPANLPWKKLGIDIVVESTGIFDSYEKSSAHVKAGAKRVVISAPVKDGDGNSPTVLMGVNNDKLSTCSISSNASCTTNAASPLIAILEESIGVEKAILNTVHGYTATQSLVDSSVRGADWRRGRAAAVNITPSSTGAAMAVTRAITSLGNKFDGIAMRVPVVSGSIVDVTFVSKRNVTVEELNNIFKEAAATERWRDIFAVTEDLLVSSDIVGSYYGSIADLSMTRVVDGNLVKVLAWYDNEAGYTNMLLKHVIEASKYV